MHEPKKAFGGGKKETGEIRGEDGERRITSLLVHFLLQLHVLLLLPLLDLTLDLVEPGRTLRRSLRRGRVRKGVGARDKRRETQKEEHIDRKERNKREAGSRGRERY